MKRAFWQYALAPLQLPYRLGVSAKNLAYDRNVLRAHALDWPVISIGNLAVGGAGKTPIVIALASLMAGHGVDVLSRGYGRRDTQAVEQVLAHGEASRFGDEPLLIARATGVPVFIGASRHAAGRLAEASAPQARGVHLLDDGFQHRRLARTIDIVVIHPHDVEDALLPFGRLREPLAALKRADYLVLRADDAQSEPALRKAGIDKPVWRVRRSLMPPVIEGAAAAFSGIAHPEEFFGDLRRQGVPLGTTLAFRDHHRYRPHDLVRIAAAAHGAAAVLTTEKDYVRFSQAAREQLSQAAPLLSVPLRADFLEPQGVLQALLLLLDKRSEKR